MTSSRAIAVAVPLWLAAGMTMGSALAAAAEPAPDPGAATAPPAEPPAGADTAESGEPAAAPVGAPVVELTNPEPPPKEEPATTAPPSPAAPPPAPTAAPAPAAPAALPVRGADAPVSRAERPFAIGGEIGWNSLAGLGVQATYHPIPYLAVDLGVGLSQVGYKGGIRVRANPMTSEWTPVVGAGFLYGLGTLGQTADVKVEDETVTIQIYRSKYLQAVAGVNYTSANGFVFMATGGYAFLLRENVRYVSGSRDALDTIKPFLHGGVSLAFTFGYAW